jgi:hypothetical protein
MAENSEKAVIKMPDGWYTQNKTNDNNAYGYSFEF